MAKADADHAFAVPTPPHPQPAPSPRVTSEGRAGRPSAAEPTEELPATPPLDTADAGDVWLLVQRAQAGDREAFGQIYDRYVDMVFRYVYYRVGDRNLAEDFTSETFLRALRRLDSFTYQGRDIGAWLVTIARNIVFDHVKSSRYRLEIVTADLHEPDPGDEQTPETAVLTGMTNAHLLRCVRELGTEQQECIVLRFLQGLSIADTARIMGKQDGAIKALQHRAVRRLGRLVQGGPAQWPRE